MTTARIVIEDDAANPAIYVVARDTAPTSAAEGDFYFDDGTNTVTGQPGWRRYNGTSWEDVEKSHLQIDTTDVSNPPTDAELDAIFGSPSAVGAGYQIILDDNGADTNVYRITSNGTSWWIDTLTKAT